MSIIIINVSIEAYYSISMVKYYHELLQQVYSIISTKISDIEPDLASQIFFEIINNFVVSNRLVLTLLIFGAHPRMTELDRLSPSIIQHTMAMKKAINKVRIYTIS